MKNIVKCILIALVLLSGPAYAQMTPLPGEYGLLAWRKATFLTAIGRGGRTTDAIRTDATQAGVNEKFRIWSGYPYDPRYRAIQTANGNFITAVGAGGLDSGDAIHTDATLIQAWETFRFVPQWVIEPLVVPWSYSIATFNGHFLTALGGGGISSGTAVHTDATKIDNWETFQVQKCGDLGSGLQYRLLTIGGQWMTALGGGGRAQGAVSYTIHDFWTTYSFLRQNDGSYALQTINGINYLTALEGGGLATSAQMPDVFATDRTHVLAWEKFRILDQGDCTYVIQTVNGSFANSPFSSAGNDLNTATRWTFFPVGL